MSVYVYSARDKSGKIISGNQEAANESAAIRLLQGQELTVTKIVEVSAQLRVEKTEKVRLHKKIKQEDLTLFVRQLATLLDSNVPLLRSMEIIMNVIQSTELLSVMQEMKQDMQAGASLKNTIASHPRVFPELWCHLIEAGEVSGSLPMVLSQLADHLEASTALRKKIVSALVYPAILIFVAIIAVLVFLIFIVPVFSNLFKMFHAELPIITRIVMDISLFVKSFILYLIAALGIGVYFFKRYIETPTGRRSFDHFVLKIPLIEVFIRDAILARTCLTMGTLIKNGVNFLKTLEISSRVAGNVVYYDAMQNTINQVQQGRSLSEGLSKSTVFPYLMVNLISIGEESGKLPEMLDRLSKYYQDRVDTFIGRLSTIIEPVILVFVGGFIGFIAIAVFMPIFSLSSVIK